MLPYASYCVLFDTRFAGGAIQLLYAVVLSRSFENHKISTYLFPCRGNSICRAVAESVIAPIIVRARRLFRFIYCGRLEIYRNITIIPFNWKHIHFVYICQ